MIYLYSLQLISVELSNPSFFSSLTTFFYNSIWICGLFCPGRAVSTEISVLRYCLKKPWRTEGISFLCRNSHAATGATGVFLKKVLPDHFVFFCEKHIYRVCKDYIEYYNHGRPSQALHAISDPYLELMEPPQMENGKVIALPILGGIHHDYRLVA